MVIASKLSALWEVVKLVPTKEQWYQALAQRHGEKAQNKFAAAVVAICGLGGLGSNVAISLARAGVGNLILIDFDKVDISNLHRQQYKASQIGMNKTDALSDNLLEITPYINLKTHTVRITEKNATELLEKADIICEAFDDPKYKALITNHVLEKMPDKYLIAASGMAGMGSANTIQTRRVLKNFYLCGDGKSDVQKEGSLISSRVMICAAHQAHTALRILTENFEI